MSASTETDRERAERAAAARRRLEDELAVLRSRRRELAAITEEIAEGEETTTITSGSPLGRALAGGVAGSTVTYRTPAGAVSAEVVEIRLPGSPAR